VSSQEAAGTSKPRKAKVQLYGQPKCKGRYAVFTHSVADLRANGWEHSGSARNPGKRITCYERINYGGARFSLAPGEAESAVVCRVTESAGPPRPHRPAAVAPAEARTGARGPVIKGSGLAGVIPSGSQRFPVGAGAFRRLGCGGAWERRPVAQP